MPAEQDLACTLAGANYAGITADELCELLKAALPDGGRGMEAELVADTPHRATASLRWRGGAEIAALEFAVTDAALSRASWERFARSIGSEAARRLSE